MILTETDLCNTCEAIEDEIMLYCQDSLEWHEIEYICRIVSDKFISLKVKAACKE